MRHETLYSYLKKRWENGTALFMDIQLKKVLNVRRMNNLLEFIAQNNITAYLPLLGHIITSKVLRDYASDINFVALSPTKRMIKLPFDVMNELFKYLHCEDILKIVLLKY